MGHKKALHLLLRIKPSVCQVQLPFLTPFFAPDAKQGPLHSTLHLILTNLLLLWLGLKEGSLYLWVVKEGKRFIMGA